MHVCRLVHLFIADGHLVQYHISGLKTYHKRRKEVINLIDAYAISGLLAVHMLPSGEYQPNAPPTARRYRDGLESDDRDEDTIFIVLYYPHSYEAAMGSGHPAIPTLGSERKILIARARSKVERNLWCWAINTEIERVARSNKDREEALRASGSVQKWHPKEDQDQSGDVGRPISRDGRPAGGDSSSSPRSLHTPA